MTETRVVEQTVVSQVTVTEDEVTVVALEEGATGPAGPAGPAGPPGVAGDPGIEVGPVAPSDTDILWADTSEPGDAVVPVGGAQGESLVKASASDYDTTWAAVAPAAAGVPVGGSTGQVLAKSSNSDYATGWANLTPGFDLPFASNGYRFVPGMMKTARGSFTHIANNIFYWPVVIRQAVAFDAFALSVQTAQASSEVRQAIYACDSTWTATSLVIQSSAIDTSTTGEKIDTVSTTTLQPGRYLLASRSNDSVQVFGASVIWMDLAIGAADANALYHQYWGLTQAEVYGAYVNPPISYVGRSTAAGQYVCPVVLRSAAL